MIRSFKDSGTEDVFYRRDTKAARKVCPPDATKAAQRKLDYLHSAKDLGELVKLPAEFKRLTGPMKGWSSLRVNDKVRILFQWVDGAAEDVEITDYH